MSGTILERLSGKKLAVLCLVLFICQIICFLIGGLISPAPTNVQQILASTCIDKQDTFGSNLDNFIYMRPFQKANCLMFDLNDYPDERELDKFAKIHNLTANNLIFVFQIPLPKDNMELDMSRWFTSMLSLLMVDIEYHAHMPLTAKYMRIEAKLGYRNKKDPPNKWKLIAHSHLDRLLNCHIDAKMKVNGYYYSCPPQPFFELGNVYHDYYLVNLRIPTYSNTEVNSGLGKIKDLWLVEIHQNGGFTRVWYSLKIVWFPVVIALAAWFWHRVLLASNGDTTLKLPKFLRNLQNQLGHSETAAHTYNGYPEEIKFRPLNNSRLNQNYSNGHQLINNGVMEVGGRAISLLEYTILCLALGTTFLNIPVDIFTLWFDMPYMLFFSDIRQGLFYVVLFVFWIIFCGEHLIDDYPRNRLSAYWKYLSGVGAGSILLFVFELCERGVELKDPFFSIWATEAGTKLAVVILALSCICLAAYLTLLTYLIYFVFRNISRKRLALPAMNKTIKMKYEGIIYRFKFLMAATGLCAALTVTYFLMSHVNENHWKWGQGTSDVGGHSSTSAARSRFSAHSLLPNLEYTSAFYTGVYGMWNLYVVAVLILYAPSHKTKTDDLSEEGECINVGDENEGNIQSTSSSFNYGARGAAKTDTTALTTFLTKENID